MTVNPAARALSALALGSRAPMTMFATPESRRFSACASP
jgi:hypothetical protein